MDSPLASSAINNGVPRLGAAGFKVTAFGHYLMAELDPKRGVIRIPVQEMRSVSVTTSRYFTALRFYLGEDFEFVEEIENPFTGQSTEGITLLENALNRGIWKIDKAPQQKAGRKRWLRLSQDLADTGDALPAVSVLSSYKPKMVAALLEGSRLYDCEELLRPRLNKLIDTFELAKRAAPYSDNIMSCRASVADAEAEFLINKIIAKNLKTYADR